jgi:L,D-transpeptidase YbiS
MIKMKVYQEFINAPLKHPALQLRETIRTTMGYSINYFKSKIIVLTAVTLFIALPLLIRFVIWHLPPTDVSSTNDNNEMVLPAQKKIKKEITLLDKILLSKKPKSNYLVINSTSNEFKLYKGDKLVKSDKCSTGSYILLKNGDNEQWMFKTPKGEFRIQGKTTSPVWKKPDWAFVEEGKPVPSSNHNSRFEYGVLGDYALSLGHGYLIHGTLYQRFLGLPVTHGCIRLNDENLDLVYHSLQVGSKVYIF